MMRRVLWSAMTLSAPCMHLARAVRWSLGGILCLGILIGIVPSGRAEIYRWRDAAGRIHFTDNFSHIPEAYRRQAQPFATESTPTSTPEVSLPVLPEEASEPSQRADTPSSGQSIPMLERQIAAAEQESQGYLDQLNAVRPIRMNPAFGQQRRRVAEIGRALAAVERQLDALHAELQRAQEADTASQGSPEGGPLALPPGATPYPDAAEMASGWQQRLRTAQDRLQQAQERRQVVLAELSGETEHQRESFGRRGLEVLEQAKELQRLTQEIRSTQAELRSLNAEAARAGLPPEGRQ